MLINSIVWDVNPEIFRTGNFAIRWYGLLFAMSFIFGYFIMQKIFKTSPQGAKGGASSLFDTTAQMELPKPAKF